MRAGIVEGNRMGEIGSCDIAIESGAPRHAQVACITTVQGQKDFNLVAAGGRRYSSLVFCNDRSGSARRRWRI